MESNLSSVSPSFTVLLTRLVTLANTRISNGEFSERSLARVLEISQPQLHNVLKRARKLQPKLADRLMDKLDLSVLDLLYTEEIIAELDLRRGQACTV